MLISLSFLLSFFELTVSTLHSKPYMTPNCDTLFFNEGETLYFTCKSPLDIFFVYPNEDGTPVELTKSVNDYYDHIIRFVRANLSTDDSGWYGCGKTGKVSNYTIHHSQRQRDFNIRWIYVKVSPKGR